VTYGGRPNNEDISRATRSFRDVTEILDMKDAPSVDRLESLACVATE